MKGNVFQTMWTNAQQWAHNQYKALTDPTYQANICRDDVGDDINSADIASVDLYMKKLERRSSIFMPYVPTSYNFGSYHDASQSGTDDMLILDYLNDADIDEEPVEMELQLKYVDLEDNHHSDHTHSTRSASLLSEAPSSTTTSNLGTIHRPSQYVDTFDIEAALEEYNDRCEIAEDNEESDQSVQTTVISNGSKRASISSNISSNSSHTPFSVDSVSSLVLYIL